MKRGRKSLADLATIAQATDSRPGAPYGLGDDAASVWESTVQAMPPSWFRPETWPLLEAFCRHVVTGRKLSAEIERGDRSTKWLRNDDDAKRLDLLTRMRDRETKAAVATARSLRLTKSSQMRSEAAGRAVRDNYPGVKPWEFTGSKRKES
jgi:hypothetical protein